MYDFGSDTSDVAANRLTGRSVYASSASDFLAFDLVGVFPLSLLLGFIHWLDKNGKAE
jgi:hypothetical protein